MPADSAQLLDSPQITALLARIRSELSADFPASAPIRVARAPGRLDVMGGIADYTGSLVCPMPLACAAAVALSPRQDRQLQVFSFNLFDAHLPFTFRIPLDALAHESTAALRREFDAPGRKFAAYLAGCLHILHQRKFIDLADPSIPGLNLALLSDVPQGAGLSSSAAIEVAAMAACAGHFGLEEKIPPLDLAVLCQEVENHVVGAPCGLMDQAASTLGRANSLLRLLCQPHTLEAPLPIPPGARLVAIDSAVRHSVAGPQYALTRCAAFMAHKMILDGMAFIGRRAGRALLADPTRGYLANLDPDAYKSLFREHLPESLAGADFLSRFGPTADTATSVDPAAVYAVRAAADHHVLEAARVRKFAQFLEESTRFTPGTRQHAAPLDKAGHLLYASHLSYSNCAGLGATQCDLLVDLVRQHEPAGLFGARITGGGQGGSVAILLDTSARASDALEQILQQCRAQTGLPAALHSDSSDGASTTGSALIPSLVAASAAHGASISSSPSARSA